MCQRLMSLRGFFSTQTSCSGSCIVCRHVKPIRLGLVVQYTLIDVSISARVASASSAANGVKGFTLLLFLCNSIFPDMRSKGAGIVTSNKLTNVLVDVNSSKEKLS